MTTKELSQLRHLRRELEEDEAKLEELQRELDGASGPNLNNVTVTGGKKYRSSVEARAIAVEYLREMIDERRTMCAARQAEIVEYISKVDDSETRLIFKYRYEECLSWVAVAKKMGPGYSVDACKKRVYRYMCRVAEEEPEE